MDKSTASKWLAMHLLNVEDNELLELHEIRGFVSYDIVGALKEAYAVSQGTKCQQFLFHVSLNPPETENVGIETFEDAAARIEKKTGLTGHPRIIIFHDKEGLHHAHVACSRIDADRVKAVNLSYFKFKPRDISRALYLENDWRMPRGLMNYGANDPRNFTLAEWQQSKRMGFHVRDLEAMMKECWVVSDSRAAFEHALGERGMILAKGDSTGHVAVTLQGEVMSIIRKIGKRAKEVRAKLGEPDTLPSVEEARYKMAYDLALTFKRHAREARVQMATAMGGLDALRVQMTTQHDPERRRLEAGQKKHWMQEAKDSAARLKKRARRLMATGDGRARLRRPGKRT